MSSSKASRRHSLNTSLMETLSSHDNILFKNCRLLRNGALVKDDLWVKNGKIVDGQSWFYDMKKQATRVVDCKGNILAPGFIDLQLNGGFGVDFSIPDDDDLPRAVKFVAKKLLEDGVIAFCPTIITSPQSVYSKLLPQHKTVPGGQHGAAILGLHLEGPFINPAKNGCHPVPEIKNFGLGPPEQSQDDAAARIADIVPKDATPEKEAAAKRKVVEKAVDDVYPDLDNVSIVTLAPEIAGSLDAIKYLTSKGITVSLGHSRSGENDAVQGVLAGASKITHMFNAMSAFHHRDPGIVGLIADEEVCALDRTLFYGVIVDGFHTHPTAVRMAHATHPEGCVLVTDAMAGMGLPPGEHGLGSLRVNISEERKATLYDEPETLAGSVATMQESVQNFAKIVGMEHALEAASLHPAQCLGIDHQKGCLLPGRDADFVLLNDDLEVQATYIAGKVCYSRDAHAAALFYSPKR
eukprot:m.20746 g.20746  ORF g.20746 m.20746 type:complete len:466 (+) comp3823_c0_seq1:220-1617(+)